MIRTTLDGLHTSHDDLLPSVGLLALDRQYEVLQREFLGGILAAVGGGYRGRRE